MLRVPLSLEKGHLFVTLPEGRFLLDTGAPASFGRIPALSLDGQSFAVAARGPLTTDELIGFIGREADGLIGTDILNQFDIVFDVPQSTARFSVSTMGCEGDILPLDFMLGIPLLDVVINGTPMRVFFDSGAQLSYFSDRVLPDSSEGRVTDFFPGLGWFETDSFRLPVHLGDTMCELRCGRVPPLVGAILMVADAGGIVGSELFHHRRIGYFPRRRRLVLGSSQPEPAGTAQGFLRAAYAML
jgi:hypothetical protein